MAKRTKASLESPFQRGVVKGPGKKGRARLRRGKRGR
jgi:hypothetical protein